VCGFSVCAVRLALRLENSCVNGFEASRSMRPIGKMIEQDVAVYTIYCRFTFPERISIYSWKFVEVFS
jgi:hypothetical protein